MTTDKVLGNHVCLPFGVCLLAGKPLDKGVQHNRRTARAWGISVGWVFIGVTTYPVEDDSAVSR